MEAFHGFINDINGILWSYVLVYLLFGVGIYFTIRFGFLQFRGLKRACQVTFAKAGPGEISSFQAFATGLASRVGMGNIAGVATAISVGGPGAVFWMWVTALLGMSSAFVEATLAQIFKVKNGDGTFRGGPAYYIQQGLGSRGWGIAFALSLLLAFGLVFNALQSNAIAESMEVAFGIDRTLMGIILVAASGAVIFGGARRIGKVAEILVPVMAVIYLLVAVYAIITNIGELPRVLGLIVSAAFNPQAALGGAAGVGLKQAMEMGIKRGLFSNEAGMGSAPNAAASASTPHPVNQGLLQMLGVFVDTIIVCSATALIILLSPAYTAGDEAKGIALTQAAVNHHVGAGGPGFLAIAIFLFAFTSIIGNYAYAESNINFIKRSPTLVLIFRLMVLGMVMFGATGSLPLVWDMADVSMGFMALINLAAILLLSKFSFAAWKDYASQLKAGKEPVFKSESIEGLKGKLMDDNWK
ncbi:sodium:alanine symporter [Formosimonas limnophila]|uniref:Sodium:alanine symporter n=1 Tax=Formosimonas limnophila TaxID=1384487 RepID=A0A8J3CIQ9_9BURK|nr:sodium:alanine symporter family protein [Formosimonas limnophila]GHA77881.1 sodium:alanine symporter [Formosimonas limnophila]